MKQKQIRILATQLFIARQASLTRQPNQPIPSQESVNRQAEGEAAASVNLAKFFMNFLDEHVPDNLDTSAQPVLQKDEEEEEDLSIRTESGTTDIPRLEDEPIVKPAKKKISKN